MNRNNEKLNGIMIVTNNKTSDHHGVQPLILMLFIQEPQQTITFPSPKPHTPYFHSRVCHARLSSSYTICNLTNVLVISSETA
mmetsp:Transcript_1654/g.3809  ORF Transcript_1654/g.3809 Transcript_1654/m.3809 type:complete len:83 (-) Transcript_1654:500-748(-)